MSVLHNILQGFVLCFGIIVKILLFLIVVWLLNH